MSPKVKRLVSIPKRHSIDFFAQSSPVVRQQLRVLDALLAPILVQTTDVILATLKEENFVTDAFLDEDRPSMLGDNRLLVLGGCQWVSNDKGAGV